MEGPPQTGSGGGFPSEPKEDLGSDRVINKTSKQVVQSEVHGKTTKFMFFWTVLLLLFVMLLLFQSLSGGGGGLCVSGRYLILDGKPQIIT